MDLAYVNPSKSSTLFNPRSLATLLIGLNAHQGQTLQSFLSQRMKAFTPGDCSYRLEMRFGSH